MNLAHMEPAALERRRAELQQELNAVLCELARRGHKATADQHRDRAEWLRTSYPRDRLAHTGY